VCVAAIQVSGNDYVEHSSPIQLMCNATGRPDPPHNVDWFKDGRIVHSDVQRGLIVTKKIETKLLVSVLSIRSARQTDAGVYKCVSSDNELASIKVHVLSGTSRDTLRHSRRRHSNSTRADKAWQTQSHAPMYAAAHIIRGEYKRMILEMFFVYILTVS